MGEPTILKENEFVYHYIYNDIGLLVEISKDYICITHIKLDNTICRLASGVNVGFQVNEIMDNQTNLEILLKTWDEDELNLAQSICHKLVTIVKQLKLNTDDVIRMDIHKDKYCGEWKACVERICTLLKAITS